MKCAVRKGDSMIQSGEGGFRPDYLNDVLTKRVESVSLSDISQEPGPTTMSFGYDPAPLQHSISRAGMVNPPIVREEANAKATIIAGFRRIQAARSLGWETVRSSSPSFRASARSRSFQ